MDGLHVTKTGSRAARAARNGAACKYLVTGCAGGMIAPGVRVRAWECEERHHNLEPIVIGHKSYMLGAMNGARDEA